MGKINQCEIETTSDGYTIIRVNMYFFLAEGIGRSRGASESGEMPGGAKAG